MVSTTSSEPVIDPTMARDSLPSSGASPLLQMTRFDRKKSAKQEGYVPPWTRDLHTINIALTGRCNLRCPCCYKDLNGKELPVERLLYTIDRLHEVGYTTTLMLAGGEPLLYRGIFDVIKRARSYDMEVYIGTNGTLLRDEKIKQLKEVDVTRVCIGVDPDLVESPAKDPRAYEKTIRAFGRLKQHGVYGVANLIVTHQNLPVLEELVELLIAEGAAGVNFLRPKLQKIGEWYEEAKLDWKDMRHLQYLFAKLRRRDIDVYFDCAFGMLLEGLPRDLIRDDDPSPTCAAGIDYLNIDQDGSIVACPYLHKEEYIVGNIVTDDLVDVWRDGHTWADLRAPREFSGSCGSCYMKDDCGGCRAITMWEGDIKSQDPSCFRGQESTSMAWLRRFRFIGTLITSMLLRRFGRDKKAKLLDSGIPH